MRALAVGSRIGDEREARVQSARSPLESQEADELAGERGVALKASAS